MNAIVKVVDTAVSTEQAASQQAVSLQAIRELNEAQLSLIGGGMAALAWE